LTSTVFAAEVTKRKFLLHYSRVSVPGNEVQQMHHPRGGNVTQTNLRHTQTI